jgi:mono/diheme cytochrome c family protein
VLILWLACDADPVLALEGDPATGERIYQAECAFCHAPDATGTPRGPELTGLYDQTTEQEALQVIREGRGEMQGFADRLTEPELADLLAWLGTL